MVNKLKTLANKNKFFERIIYICYRICTLFYSLLFLVCRVFPIKENKIAACNMKGKRYGDNPKYILDEIIRQNLDYELIWLLKDKRDPEMPKEIKCASYNPFSLAYHLSTAKVWIDTNMKAIGTLKRKGQIYIQTWHGSPSLKKLALDIDTKTSLFATKPYQYNANVEDLMISNCRQSTKMFRRAFAYKGEILECGCPRNDIFFEARAKYQNKVINYFGIKNKNILLYAPTFRDDFSTESLNLNIEEVLSTLSQRFGGDWIALIRLHPNNITVAEQFISYSDRIINATDYNVMQELLVASDVLITDYSSSMFDFSITKRPCFLYATDIDAYKRQRDFYFNIMKLPFKVSQNDYELIQCINEFDQNLYEKNLKKFFIEIGLCENGTAAKKVVKYIERLRSKGASL